MFKQYKTQQNKNNDNIYQNTEKKYFWKDLNNTKNNSTENLMKKSKLLQRKNSKINNNKLIERK